MSEHSSFVNSSHRQGGYASESQSRASAGPGPSAGSGAADASDSFYVVGIGASAGGLDALARFFRNVPPHAPMAFVVIQHLSPNFKSLMSELLARQTKLPIFRAEHGMEVRPGCIYLNPPRTNTILFEGKLLLTDTDPEEALNLPIDVFLQSLAQDIGTRAVSIILSGSRSMCESLQLMYIPIRFLSQAMVSIPKRAL